MIATLVIAETYYHQMLKKNFDAMGLITHEDVYFISYLAEMPGENAVIDVAKNLGDILMISKYDLNSARAIRLC